MNSLSQHGCSIGQNYVCVMGELWEFFGCYQKTIAIGSEPFDKLKTNGLKLKLTIFAYIRHKLLNQNQALDYLKIKSKSLTQLLLRVKAIFDC